MESACIHLLLYKHSSGSYDCTCRPGYTDSGRLCTGLFSINLHFPIYFRHSISLDSCLLKFSFRFFFYQTSMNARAKTMTVTQMQTVSTLLAPITARVGLATKGMGPFVEVL